jgi:hypothetical protein
VRRIHRSTTAWRSGAAAVAALAAAVVLTACGGSSSSGSSTSSAAPSTTSAASSSSEAPSSSASPSSSDVPSSSDAPTSSDTPSSSGSSAAPSGLTCPQPSAVKVDPELSYTWTRCFTDNSWLIASGAAPTGDPIDGVSVIHQTAAGKFDLVAQGSSFDDAAQLESRGVPAVLVTLLTHPGAEYLYENAVTDSTMADFVGTWSHGGLKVEIPAQGEGSLVVEKSGSSIDTTMDFVFEKNGMLQGKVSGTVSLTDGDSMVKLTGDTPIWFHVASGASGPILLSSNFEDPAKPALAWCGKNADPRCTA